MILYQEFWVRYKINAKTKDDDPKKNRRFFKWWSNISEPPDTSEHQHHFEVVGNEQDIEKCKEEIVNTFVESKKNEGQIVILEQGIEKEKYVKDLPMNICLELLTPAQLVEEFGYLWQEISLGLM